MHYQDPIEQIRDYEQKVNEEAARLRTVWITFMTLMAYSLVTLGSITHRDILLEAPLQLPLLQVQLPLVGFFTYAPFFLLVFHVYFLFCVLSLWESVHEYQKALSCPTRLSVLKKESRRRLDSFVFVQAFDDVQLQSTRKRKVFSVFVTWLMIVALPIVLLLFVLGVFLPYQSLGVTLAHIGIVLVDVFAVGVFYRHITQRGGIDCPSLFINLLRSRLLVALSGIVVLASLVFLMPIQGVLLLQNIIPITNLVEKWPGPNRLSLAGQDLVSFERVDLIENREPGDGSLSWEMQRTLTLSERSFVGADLRRGDLRYAILEKADLRYALLNNAQLQNVELKEATLHGANLEGARLAGANMDAITMLGGSMARADLRGADFSCAGLYGVQLEAANLQGAYFANVQLHEVSFVGSNLAGADFKRVESSHLKFSKANLTGAHFASGQNQCASNRVVEPGWPRSPCGLGCEIRADVLATVVVSPERLLNGQKCALAIGEIGHVVNRLEALSCSDWRSPYVIRGLARRIGNGFDDASSDSVCLHRAALHRRLAKIFVEAKRCPSAEHLSADARSKLLEIASN